MSRRAAPRPVEQLEQLAQLALVHPNPAGQREPLGRCESVGRRQLLVDQLGCSAYVTAAREETPRGCWLVGCAACRCPRRPSSPRSRLA